jgi:hypothetical protein
MQSVSAKPLGSYPWLVRLLFRMQRRIFGRVLDSSLLWARSPREFAAFVLFRPRAPNDAPTRKAHQKRPHGPFTTQEANAIGAASGVAQNEDRRLRTGAASY